MEVNKMINEAVENEGVEVVEKIANGRSLGGIAVGAGVAAAVVSVGFVAYKKIVKPAIAKRKAKKEAEAESQDFADNESEDQE